MVRNDVFYECDHLVVPSFWVLGVGGVLAADNDEVVLVIEVWIVSFGGLVKSDFGVWSGAANAFMIALVNLLVEGCVGVEDDGDAGFELDHRGA